ncbi:MAG: hypothetical protein ABIK23_04655 [candidate division WOR-3 bacterium]
MSYLLQVRNLTKEQFFQATIPWVVLVTVSAVVAGAVFKGIFGAFCGWVYKVRSGFALRIGGEGPLSVVRGLNLPVLGEVTKSILSQVILIGEPDFLRMLVPDVAWRRLSDSQTVIA